MFKIIKHFIKKNKQTHHHDFSIDEEADKLGMTVSEYEKEILHKHDKIKLDEIYALHEDEMKVVRIEKQKFNNEVKESGQRRMDFQELEEFMNSL